MHAIRVEEDAMGKPVAKFPMQKKITAGLEHRRYPLNEHGDKTCGNYDQAQRPRLWCELFL